MMENFIPSKKKAITQGYRFPSAAALLLYLHPGD